MSNTPPAKQRGSGLEGSGRGILSWRGMGRVHGEIVCWWGWNVGSWGAAAKCRSGRQGARVGQRAAVGGPFK